MTHWILTGQNKGSLPSFWGSFDSREAAEAAAAAERDAFWRDGSGRIAWRTEIYPAPREDAEAAGEEGPERRN